MRKSKFALILVTCVIALTLGFFTSMQNMIGVIIIPDVLINSARDPRDALTNNYFLAFLSGDNNTGSNSAAPSPRLAYGNCTLDDTLHSQQLYIQASVAMASKNYIRLCMCLVNMLYVDRLSRLAQQENNCVADDAADNANDDVEKSENRPILADPSSLNTSHTEVPSSSLSFKLKLVLLITLLFNVETTTLLGRSTSMTLWLKSRFGLTEFEISHIWSISGFLALPITGLILISNYYWQARAGHWIIFSTTLANAVSWLGLPLVGTDWKMLVFWNLIGNATAFVMHSLAYIFTFQVVSAVFGKAYMGRAGVFITLIYGINKILSTNLSGLISQKLSFEVFCFITFGFMFAMGFTAFYLKGIINLSESVDKA